jgi:nitrate/TMAO reductase-like tetraheme cytochrome c subunit
VETGRHDGVVGLVRNPISLLGAILAALGLGGLVFVLAIEFLQVRPSPYIGAFAFMVLPVVMVGGLLVIPAGMLWEARRRAAAARRGEGLPPALQIDFGKPSHLRGVFFFGVSTIVILAVLGASAFRTVEFMDSPTFCGKICHKVMAPQYETYKAGPHAQVACTTCHIGPGASWYVQSKLSGTRQVLAVLTSSYPEPIPAPIENLRPARDTCEECHWRERTYGLRLRVFRHYIADEKNTLQIFPLAFRVGTGGDEPRGVHWHTSAKVWYQPATEDRQVMAWVGVEENGQIVKEYENPDVGEDSPKLPRRLMDCVDCHNRAAHDIPSPAKLIDDGLASGRLDSNLPYLKREALRLLKADEANPDARQLQALWTDEWFQQLATFYEQNYPEVAQEKAESIRQAIQELKRISGEVIYPDMNTTWRTYPQNNGHVAAEKGDAGCFRCHGALVEVSTGTTLPGAKMGQTGCVDCHKLGEPLEQPVEGAGHSVEPEMGCNFCHFLIQPDEIRIGEGDAPVP